MNNKIAGEIKSRTPLTKSEAKHLREVAKQIENGEIRTIIMSYENTKNEITHSFRGISYKDYLALAMRLIHTINRAWDEK